MCGRYGTIEIAIQQHLLTGILPFESNTFWVSESSTQRTLESNSDCDYICTHTYTYTSIHAANLRPCHLSRDAILPSKNVYTATRNRVFVILWMVGCVYECAFQMLSFARIVSRIRWECVLYFHFSTNVIIPSNKGGFFSFGNRRAGVWEMGWDIFFLSLSNWYHRYVHTVGLNERGNSARKRKRKRRVHNVQGTFSVFFFSFSINIFSVDAYLLRYTRSVDVVGVVALISCMHILYNIARHACL